MNTPTLATMLLYRRAAAVPDEPVNLMAELNPGMETATGTGWAINFASWVETYILPDEGDCPITQDETTVHGGSYSARLAYQTDAGVSVLRSATITVTAGASYNLTVWGYGDGVYRKTRHLCDLHPASGFVRVP